MGGNTSSTGGSGGSSHIHWGCAVAGQPGRNGDGGAWIMVGAVCVAMLALRRRRRAVALALSIAALGGCVQTAADAAPEQRTATAAAAGEVDRAPLAVPSVPGGRAEYVMPVPIVAPPEQIVPAYRLAPETHGQIAPTGDVVAAWRPGQLPARLPSGLVPATRPDGTQVHPQTLAPIVPGARISNARGQ